MPAPVRPIAGRTDRYTLNTSTWVTEELLEGTVGVVRQDSCRKGGDRMSGIPQKRLDKGITGRVRARALLHFALPAAAGAVLLLSMAGNAGGALTEEDLQSGRLGYKWVPDPPKRPLTAEEELGVKVAKYGGGALVGVWLIRRLMSAE